MFKKVLLNRNTVTATGTVFYAKKNNILVSSTAIGHV